MDIEVIERFLISFLDRVEVSQETIDKSRVEIRSTAGIIHNKLSESEKPTSDIFRCFCGKYKKTYKICERCFTPVTNQRFWPDSRPLRSL